MSGIRAFCWRWRLASSLLRAERTLLKRYTTVLRLTLLTSLVASATFVGTLAFSPAVVSFADRAGWVQSEIAHKSPPPPGVEGLDCLAPLAKLIAGLRGDPCLQALKR